MEKRAVIYIRVSDQSQIENNSLETQEKACRKYALDKGYTVVEPIFREEGKSAKHIQTRPQLRNLLSFVSAKKNKIDAVIVYKFDRFSRNLEEGLATITWLAKYRVTVLSVMEDVDQGPLGKALRNIMMVLGELDNELKGERVKDNMLEVFRKGLWPFKPPVGYKRKFKTKEENKGLPLLLEPNLAPIITRMFQKAATGIYNKVQLAKAMNVDGFGTYYKSEASHKIVDQILKKTFYYGYMFAPKWNEYAWGKHEPLIDKATYEGAYNKVILKKKNYSYQDNETYPLKGLLKCGECGHPLTTCPAKGKTKIVFYYECRHKGGKKVRVNCNKAHNLFYALLQQIKPSDSVVKLFSHMVFDEWDKAIAEAESQADKLDDRIVELRKEKASIRKAKDDGLYTAAEAIEEVDRVRQEITILEIEKSDIRIEQYNKEIVREFIDQFFNHIDALWEKLDLPKKQALQQKVLPYGLEVVIDRKFRTPVLSPSFQLIQALEGEKGENVTPALPHPNSIIADLVDLIKTFLPDVQTGLVYAM
jgi:site-specific DNA recombinase